MGGQRWIITALFPTNIDLLPKRKNLGAEMSIHWKRVQARTDTVHACMLSHFSRVWLFATLWTIAHQPPLSMGFSRQEYWSGLPFPPPGKSSPPGVQTSVSYVSCIARRVLYHQHLLGSLRIDTVKSPKTNLQVSDFQRCKCASTYPIMSVS